jgi:hypothetical protein
LPKLLANGSAQIEVTSDAVCKRGHQELQWNLISDFTSSLSTSHNQGVDIQIDLVIVIQGEDSGSGGSAPWQVFLQN